MLRVDPDNLIAHNGLGLIADRAGDRSKAMDHFTSAVRADESFTLARRNLADLLVREGRLVEAIDHFWQAGEWGDATSWFRAAQLLAADGQKEKALEACENGISLSSQESSSWTLRGYLQLGLRKPQDAEKSLLQAIALDSENAEARRHLGVVYFTMRKMDSARTQLAWACAIDPRIVDSIESLVAESQEKDLFLLDVLAACLSEVEKFGAATKRAEQALLLAAQLGRDDLIPGMQERLRVYMRRQKFLSYQITRLPTE
jgi:tetratricopeptide (TPR) repeat protein